MCVCVFICVPCSTHTQYFYLLKGGVGVHTCLYTHVFMCVCLFIPIRMFIWLHIHTCLYTHVSMCVCMFMPIRMLMCSHIHLFIYSCVYVCMYAHTCALLNTSSHARHANSYATCSHVHVPTYTRLFINTHTCSYDHKFTNVYVHMCTCTQLHTGTHDHVFTWSPNVHPFPCAHMFYPHARMLTSGVHMACTHDIVCSNTHTPTYTHWFTQSHDHMLACTFVYWSYIHVSTGTHAHLYVTYIFERFHMFPTFVPKHKGGVGGIHVYMFTHAYYMPPFHMLIC